jgi:integrase
MGTIYKKGKNWYIDFYHRGKRRRKKVGPSKKLAELALKDVELRIARGEFLGMVDDRKVRFKDYAREWLKEHEIRLKPSTRADFESIFRIYLLPSYGDLYLAQIQETDIERFLGSLGHLSAKRINNIMVPLKILFRTAKRRREIRENPCEHIRPLKTEKPRIDPLSFDEVRRFLEKLHPHYHAYFFTAFFTGMRPGEQIALRWDDIDFPGRTISIRRSRVKGIEGSPKTGSSYRDIEIFPPLLDVLRAHEAKTRLKFRSPYVFTSREGGPIDLDNLRNRIWYKTLKRARIRPRRMYETRHTFATLMLSSGENPHWIARMMGHASTDMLFKRYSRWIPNLTHRDGSAFLDQWEKVFQMDTLWTPKAPKTKKRDYGRSITP